jgi:hypothetical protein
MSNEAVSTPVDEPILDQKTAKILLLMSGRAIEKGGCLVSAALQQDILGEAAFAVYDGNEEGTLSAVIEEITGSPPTLHPAAFAQIITESLIEHGIQLGLSPEEAAA